MLNNPGTEEAPRARHTSEGDVMPTLQMKRQKCRETRAVAPTKDASSRMLFFHRGPPTPNPNKQGSNGNTGCTPASKAGGGLLELEQKHLHIQEAACTFRLILLSQVQCFSLFLHSALTSLMLITQIPGKITMVGFTVLIKGQQRLKEWLLRLVSSPRDSDA